MTISRVLPWAVAVMTASAVSAANPPAAPPPASRPWLEVKLPAPPAAGAPTARATFVLRDDPMKAADWAGFRISVGGAAPVQVATGARRDFVVAASATEPLRAEIGGTPVLAHVHAGETFDVREGHDGGWIAVIGSRMRENAPKRLTLCGATRKDRDCPAGYRWTRVFQGDAVCPATDDVPFKCVKASVVRAKGPLTGRAEVTNASADGADATGTVPLTTKPLAASALGPWITVDIGPEVMPRVQLGGAAAMLVIGPGESYQVWLDDKGRVASAQLPVR